jgi:hypothetical protein
MSITSSSKLGLKFEVQILDYTIENQTIEFVLSVLKSGWLKTGNEKRMHCLSRQKTDRGELLR